MRLIARALEMNVAKSDRFDGLLIAVDVRGVADAGFGRFDLRRVMVCSRD